MTRGQSILRERFAETLKLLMASVAVLLLIVGFNVAGLLLARTAARREEIAVRLAVGASRARLLRQMLAENSLLALAGALGGVGIALLAIPLAARPWPPIRDLSGTLLPLTLDVRMNVRVLLFSMVVREIGIRMALGAVPADIAGLIGWETLAMVVGGICCGIAAALAAGPWIRSLLYGVSPWDAQSLGVAAIFVALVAGGATATLVLWATHVEPSLALHQEN